MFSFSFAVLNLYFSSSLQYCKATFRLQEMVHHHHFNCYYYYYYYYYYY